MSDSICTQFAKWAVYLKYEVCLPEVVDTLKALSSAI